MTCGGANEGVSYTGTTDWTGACEALKMGCTSLPVGSVDSRELMSDIAERLME